MAEETQTPAAAAEEVVLVENSAAATEVTEKELSSAPEPEPETVTVVAKKEFVEAASVAVEEEKAKEDEKITQSVSFKEETNVVGDLPESQKKALDVLKQLIQEALNKHEFVTLPPPPPPPKEEEKTVPLPVAVEEVKESAPAEDALAPPAAAAAEEGKEEVKAEETLAAEPKTKEEEKEVPPPPPAAEDTVVVTEVVETVAVVVDEDGTKTVEAIEETIVAVTPPTPEETVPPPAEEEVKPEAEVVPPEEASIWGIPLLADERSDVVLLKFLRAREFKVKDAFTMIRNTVRWRKEFKIDELLEEDLGTELEKVVFMQGVDKEGHPVCYNVYGEFQNKELYANTFSDEEKRLKFLRWRIQFLEKSIRKLEFSPEGICTIVQVNDLKNSPGPLKKELRQSTNQALQLLQDNYPEFVAKQVFVNVPWWYLAFNKMISPFLTLRTKSKFVFAGPSRTANTLFKYISPEQVPVKYGGLSRDGEQEFTTADSVTEVIIKPATKHTIEFPATEISTVVWELRVVGWEVTYGAEFVPTAEEGYTVIVSKARKMAPTDEPVVSNSFKIGEPGKIVLTIDNQSSKKKKLLCRSKTVPVACE